VVKDQLVNFPRERAEGVPEILLRSTSGMLLLGPDDINGRAFRLAYSIAVAVALGPSCGEEGVWSWSVSWFDRDSEERYK
jgi:hypothetical protein